MRAGAVVHASADSVTLTVRVVPRAPRSMIAGIRGEALLIRLNAPPVDGAANDALVRLIADACRIPTRLVVIVAGERGRSKTVRISGLSVEDVRARLGLDER